MNTAPATVQPRSSLRIGLTYRRPVPPREPGAPLFRPTVAHFARWADRHRPKWAQGLTLPIAGLDVDALINARAGIRFPNNVHNALSLALLARRNCETGAQSGTFGDFLRTFRDGSAAASCKRGHIFARWVRGLDRANARAARTRD